jgi:hypothetical protein
MEAKMYEIRADDVSVWSAQPRPTRDEIDRTAIYASGKGWNGTTLDLYCDGAWREELRPDPAALDAATIEEYYDILDADNACPSGARAE